MHIGLLEDDPAIQEMLRLVLQDEGYDVSIYSTAEACLQVFTSPDCSNSIPALLIVDWRLAGPVQGTDVIRQIRKQPQLLSLPIILTTAATITTSEKFDDLDVALLEKPFSLDEVVNLITTQVKTQPGNKS